MTQPLFYTLEDLASHAKLRVGWCEYAVNLLVAALRTHPKIKAKVTRARDASSEDRGLLTCYECAYYFATHTVRPLIAEGVAHECWQSVLRYAQEDDQFGVECPPDDPVYKRWIKRAGVVKYGGDKKQRHLLWIQNQIGLALGTDSTNIGRWETKKTTPGGNKVLTAILVVLKAELRNVDFLDRYELISNVAARTLALIKQSGYGGAPSSSEACLPTPQEITALRALFREKWADALVPSVVGKMDAECDEALTNVATIIGGRDPSSPFCDVSALDEVVTKWGPTYALLRIGLASGWPDGSEDVRNWSEIEDPSDPAEWDNLPAL